jgi:tripartite-type tricarboxylate transporter receptor subunit TctC
MTGTRRFKSPLGMAVILCLAMLAAACGTDPEPAADSPDVGTAQPAPEPAPEPVAEPEEADDAAALEEFYGGNTITWVVATSPGGPFDTYARTIARYMPSYIPGEPEIIVENMPGAGHIVAMNHVYQAADRDGTVMGMATGGLALQQLFGDDRIAFDMTELFYLGIPDRLGTRVLVARQEVVPEGGFADIVEGASELVIGGSAPGSVQFDPAVLLRDVLGANVRVVAGYEGTAPLELAMEQGEIDAHFGSFHSFLLTAADRLESEEWVILAKFAEADEGEPELADVPSVYDFAESARDKEMLYFGAGYPRSYVRLVFLPPDVPEERALALRTAFDQTLADEDFLAEADRLDLDITPTSGEDTAAAIADFLQMSVELRDALEEILGV